MRKPQEKLTDIVNMIKNTGIQRETDRKTETEIEKGRGDRHTEREEGSSVP